MSFARHQATPTIDADVDVARDNRACGHDRRHAHVCACVRRLFTIAVLVALSIIPPRPAQAQAGRAALGLVGGLVAGVHVTTGIFVARSRIFHHDVHSTEDLISLRPETLPIVAMPVAFAVVGYRSSSRLAGAATWGGFGLVTGAAVGAGLGHLLSGTSGGRWAGGTIGSAAGLALGAVLGAALLSDDGDPDEGAIAGRRYIGVSIPFGAGR